MPEQRAQQAYVRRLNRALLLYVLGLLGFIGTVALAKMLMRGDLVE